MLSLLLVSARKVTHLKSLTKHGFKLVKEKQNTVCFHVDNCKISHEYEYANVVDKTMDWL